MHRLKKTSFFEDYGPRFQYMYVTVVMFSINYCTLLKYRLIPCLNEGGAVSADEVAALVLWRKKDFLTKQGYKRPVTKKPRKKESGRERIGKGGKTMAFILPFGGNVIASLMIVRCL
jgi:hypothetical protein